MVVFLYIQREETENFYYGQISTALANETSVDEIGKPK